MDAAFLGDLLDDQSERHDRVRHGERLGVLQVDLVLAWSILMKAVLDRDRERFEVVQRRPAQIRRDIGCREIEVGGGVERLRNAVVLLEVEEFDLGRGEEGVASVVRAIEIPSQDLARIAGERGSVEVFDIAKHEPGRFVILCPWQELERASIRASEHIALLYPAESIDRRTIELQAFVEDLFKFGW